MLLLQHFSLIALNSNLLSRIEIEIYSCSLLRVNAMIFLVLFFCFFAFVCFVSLLLFVCFARML